MSGNYLKALDAHSSVREFIVDSKKEKFQRLSRQLTSKTLIHPQKNFLFSLRRVCKLRCDVDALNQFYIRSCLLFLFFIAALMWLRSLSLFELTAVSTFLETSHKKEWNICSELKMKFQSIQSQFVINFLFLTGSRSVSLRKVSHGKAPKNKRWS